MATYKEQQKDKKTFVLTKNGTPLATFGNLKKVVDYVVDKFDADDFPSYWTIVRKTKYPIIAGNYKIFRVRHY